MNTFPCISIQQPWAWLIANALKDIENRTWATPYRGLILIHAGQKVDPSCFDGDDLHSLSIYRMGGGPNIRSRMPLRKDDYLRGGIIGYATLKDVVTASDSPWFCGKYGFVLADAQPLPFIPLRGQLGIFSVDMSIVPLAIQQKLSENSKS